jgi:hypothetical protein
VPVVVAEQSAAAVVTAEPKRRRTAAEIENDRIVAEQMANVEREKQLEQVRAAAKREWEAGRPREPVAIDCGRSAY